MTWINTNELKCSLKIVSFRIQSKTNGVRNRINLSVSNGVVNVAFLSSWKTMTDNCNFDRNTEAKTNDIAVLHSSRYNG